MSSERFEKALAFAAEKHAGQYRIGGKPYISHPVEVAKILKEEGYGEDYQIAALFHDLLEDTDATEEEILALGGKDVLRAVQLVTKQDGYVMEEYVAAICKDPMAKAVKAADRLHNLQSAKVADPDFKRRYILESIDWYWEFSPAIRQAVRELAQTMEAPLRELPLEYTPLRKNELRRRDA